MLVLTRRAAALFPLALPIATRFANARADDAPVLIGAALPLSGSAASAGQEMKAAIEVGIDIVNNTHPELKDLPLGPTPGFPNLQGRKVAVDFADHQGNPAVAQSQTLRLITQDHVVALTGSYQSSCTLTSSAVAERYGIPFVNGESVAPNLTQRGYKWFFRTTPIAQDFAKTYSEFLLDLQKQGQKIDGVMVVNENTDYGAGTWRRHHRGDQGKQSPPRRPHPVQRQQRRSYRRGAADEAGKSYRGHLRQLYIGLDSVYQDDEGAQL